MLTSQRLVKTAIWASVYAQLQNIKLITAIKILQWARVQDIK